MIIVDDKLNIIFDFSHQNLTLKSLPLMEKLVKESNLF